MSQDASTHQMLLKPSHMPLSEPTETLDLNSATESESPVESYADRLMDDLFDDVERMLDGGIKTSVDPVPAANTPKQNKLADWVLPLMSIPQQESLPSNEPLNNTQLANAIAPENSLLTKFQGSGRSYDHWLLGLGCVSIVIALAAWLFSQQARQPVFSPPQAASQSSQVNSPIDYQFVDYMQQAIQAIDQKVQPGKVASGTVAPGTMPTVTVPGSSTSPTGRAATASAPVTRPTGLQRTAPVMPANSMSSKLSVAPLPRTSQAAVPGVVNPPIPLSVPGVARTVVGVMELGDRSAALIEINGVAQRYRVGESIGSSGWTLVEVSKNQAVVRRNGEVRSLFIGQNF